jgi:hypothetical protein
LIIEKYTRTDIEEVDDLDSTTRGEGGFGSTGVKFNGNVNKENVLNNTDSKKRDMSEITKNGIV